MSPVTRHLSLSTARGNIAVMNLRALEKLRDHIYRRSRVHRVRTFGDAAQFIERVGFCLLFASERGVELPSLFEAVKGRRDAHIDDWDADSDRVWVWKNDLPAARRAYYGKALAGGKPVFIALKFLPPFLALTAPASIEKEYARGRITHAARRVHDVLRANGPMPTMALRAAAGMDVQRYHRALDELQRAMVILPVGAIVERGAWTSQIFELLARWFPKSFEQAQKMEAEIARRALVQQYVRTVVAATMPMMARVFGWNRADLRATVDDLVKRRALKQEGEWLVIV
jgi:hypothetical protein